MTSRFDRDTALVPGDAGIGVDISPAWDIGVRPNGGYLLALVVRAMREAAGFPDPVTVTGHYLRPPTQGAARVEVETVRRGGRHGTASARLIAGGEECLRVLGTFGDLAAADGPSQPLPPAPDVPSPEDCPRLEEVPGWQVIPRFYDQIDARIAEFGSADGTVGRITGWLRFSDGRPPDADSLLLFADGLPPAVLAVTRAGWVPTVELTIHVRARPAAGWLLASFSTRFLVGGYLEEDGELWDSDGRLVALSRQLALVRGGVL
ncbi:MAG: thioesterase family protein [Acidimicrobiia bacterium]